MSRETLYLYHVFLDTKRVTAAKDTQQLLIRYKEKSWESISLGIQIIIQAFLTFSQHIIYMIEVWQTIWGFTACFYCWVFYSFIHYLHREKRKFRKYWTAIDYTKSYLTSEKAHKLHKQCRFLQKWNRVSNMFFHCCCVVCKHAFKAESMEMLL